MALQSKEEKKEGGNRGESPQPGTNLLMLGNSYQPGQDQAAHILAAQWGMHGGSMLGGAYGGGMLPGGGGGMLPWRQSVPLLMQQQNSWWGAAALRGE